MTINEEKEMIIRHHNHACFITEALKSFDINIDNIEANYDVISGFLENETVFFAKRDYGYIFIDFICENNEGIVLDLKVCDLNTNDNTITHHHLDFRYGQYFKGKGELSEESVAHLKEIPNQEFICLNDLHKMRAKDVHTVIPLYPYSGMVHYGKLICEIDTAKYNEMFSNSGYNLKRKQNN